MAKFPFVGVGFDLDGTLVDSFRDLGAAVNHALVLGGFNNKKDSKSERTTILIDDVTIVVK